MRMKHKMKATTTFIFLVSVLLRTSSMELESDVNGFQTSVNEEFGQVVAYVSNSFDFDISVYFDDGKALHYMMDIQANGSGQLNTYHGHIFHATPVGNSEPIATISILGRVTDYAFRSKTSSSLKKNPGVASTIHPAVKIIGRPTLAMNAKFRSLSGRVLDLYYDNGQGGSIQATLKSGQDSTTNAYEGHVFFYTPQGKKSEVLGQFTIKKDQVLYTLIDTSFPASKDILEYTRQEQAYQEEYRNRTGGVHWRSFYGRNGPRPPPKLFMWPADQIGQIHKVESSEGQWHCSGSAEDCQSGDPLQLELFVVSQQPRAFVINNFLSDFEADSIINLAAPIIRESTVGNNDGGGVRRDSTRTSSNTWVGRHVNNVTESLYLRASHLLNIDEALLNVNTNCEEMQVVHYGVGQKYDAHHDWGVSGYAESRFITLLLYLNNMKHEEAGGETSFPKAANGQGIKVHPGKGSAVLFYNLLEDGNADDLSLHEAVPVRDGEKWLSNFWVWDPKRK